MQNSKFVMYICEIEIVAKQLPMHVYTSVLTCIQGKSTTAKNILSTFGASQHAFSARSSTASLVNQVSLSTIPVGKFQ